MIARNIFREIVDGVIYLESLFIKPKTHTDKRVLILRKDGFGDCVLFYPFLIELRKFYTNAHVTLVLPDIFESLSSTLEDFDQIIWFSHKKFGTSFTYRRNFLLNLKKIGFDIAIYPVFTREKIGNFMMKITKAKEKYFMDKIPKSITSEFERNRFLVQKIIGNDFKISFPTINISKLPMGNLNLPESYAVVFPGAGSKYRIWPLDRFKSVIQYLLSRKITPVICGSTSEKDLAKLIFSEGAIDLTGNFDFSGLAQILNKAKFYFGSDTGAAHLAIALNIPTIVIVGSGGLDRFFPYANPKTNRIIYNRNHSFPLGSWAGEKNRDTTHPSIVSITLEDAHKEIDYMLEYLHL